ALVQDTNPRATRADEWIVVETVVHDRGAAHRAPRKAWSALAVVQRRNHESRRSCGKLMARAVQVGGIDAHTVAPARIHPDENTAGSCPGQHREELRARIGTDGDSRNVQERSLGTHTRAVEVVVLPRSKVFPDSEPVLSVPRERRPTLASRCSADHERHGID